MDNAVHVFSLPAIVRLTIMGLECFHGVDVYVQDLVIQDRSVLYILVIQCYIMIALQINESIFNDIEFV